MSSATASSQQESYTYPASCHCGTVKFTVTIPSPITSIEVTRCNCSICTKSGYFIVYPFQKDVVFQQGEDTMGSYVFGHKTKPHRFCPSCGTSILIDFSDERNPDSIREKYAVNVGTFQDIDMTVLNCKHFDGKNKLGPEYTA